MKLLLAEDETELNNALAAVLRHNNYTVDCVYDGQEALDYLDMARNDRAGIEELLWENEIGCDKRNWNGQTWQFLLIF